MLLIVVSTVLLTLPVPVGVVTVGVVTMGVVSSTRIVILFGTNSQNINNCVENWKMTSKCRHGDVN